MRIASRVAGAANASKSAFLSNVAHELRVPMHSIINFANIGRAKIAKGGAYDAEKYLSHIVTSGKRLILLLNDLLDLEKLEAGKVDYSFPESCLFDIIGLAQAELEPLLAAKGLSVSLSACACDGKANFDPRYMLQVVVNLLSNAIKYSPEDGEIAIAVSDSALASGTPALLCAMADSGPGIQINELDLIFNKFFQSGKTKPNQSSSGLGLSICKEIINAHKGRIWAENRQPTGALLQFLLPKVHDSRIDGGEGI
jgi:signal transduction histidine kinase